MDLEGEGVLSRIDPRVKLLLFLAYATVLTSLNRPSGLVVTGGYVILLALFAGRSILKPAKTLVVANTFLVFLAVTMPFSYSKGPLFHFAGLSFSLEGLKYGLFLFVKSNEILLLLLILVSTSSLYAITHALHHLGLPTKLVQMLFFSWRYLELLKEEHRCLMKSAKARGFQGRTGISTYKTMAYIMATLMLKSYSRAQKVEKAMRCRGFRGVYPLYSHFHFKEEDLLFTLANSVPLVLILAVGLQ